MKYAAWLVGLFFLATSCSDSKSDESNRAVEQQKEVGIEEMKSDLKRFEDSLKVAAKKSNGAFDKKTAVIYAEKCLAIKHRFPKSKEAPKMMDKAHIIFSSVGLHQRAVVVGDSLILMYPMYENRPMVLESLASTYDVFIQPRRKEKVKLYYEMLLKEKPNMSEEERALIEKRLKFIDLPFEDYISKLSK